MPSMEVGRPKDKRQDPVVTGGGSAGRASVRYSHRSVGAGQQRSLRAADSRTIHQQPCSGLGWHQCRACGWPYPSLNSLRGARWYFVADDKAPIRDYLIGPDAARSMPTRVHR
jgi:hypothetical protein